MEREYPPPPPPPPRPSEFLVEPLPPPPQASTIMDITPFGTVHVPELERITSQAQFWTMMVPVAFAAGPQEPTSGIE